MRFILHRWMHYDENMPNVILVLHEGFPFWSKTQKLHLFHLSATKTRLAQRFWVKLGEWVFGGLSMGHFPNFKMIWKLDRKISIILYFHFDLGKIPKNGFKQVRHFYKFPCFSACWCDLFADWRDPYGSTTAHLV